MNKLTVLVDKVTVKWWLLFLVLSQAVYLTMQIYSIPGISREAGGLSIFDMHPSGYSYAFAQDFLTRLSDQGYDLYSRIQLSLDTLFPLLNCLTGLSTFILLVRFYNRVKKPLASPVRRSLMIAGFALPLLAMIFDYLENILVSVMLSQRTAVHHTLVYTASTFTVIKSMATMIFYTVAIILLAVGCTAWWRNRMKKEPVNGEVRN